MDNYPSVVTQPGGKKVPVVQAYAYGKYLGRLDVIFDDKGDAVEWNGNPILLDTTVKQGRLVQYLCAIDFPLPYVYCVPYCDLEPA